MTELDKSWLPQPEPLPDGGFDMRLPTDTEWMLAGGTVKEEVHEGSGYNLKDDWRDVLLTWLDRWQVKNNKEGKAPKPFGQAFELLCFIEDLNFGVDFLDLDCVEDQIRRKYPGLSNEDVKEVESFILPVLQDQPWTFTGKEFKNP